MKYIVTRTFQHRGVQPKGKVLDLTAEDLANPFVAAHVAPLDGPTRPSAAQAYFGNGTPKTSPRETPAAVAAEDADGMGIEQLRAKLAKLGVHYTNKMSQAKLLALYRQAQEAVAGSPATPNRPLI